MPPLAACFNEIDEELRGVIRHLQIEFLLVHPVILPYSFGSIVLELVVRQVAKDVLHV
jgi:predicted histidine transporter YuiF (NhaC family)